MNTDLLVAAVITTILSVLVVVVIQKKLQVRPKSYYGLIVMALPFSMLVNAVKIPLLELFFYPKLNSQSLLLVDIILWLLLVGVTEELIKVAPVLFLWFRSKKKKMSELIVLAWSLGVGFGVGEIWFLASLYLNSETSDYGWLGWLTGFGVERFLVVFAHALFTMVAVFGLRSGAGKGFLTLGSAIGLHSLFNAPILLYAGDYIGAVEFSVFIQLVLLLAFISSFAMLFYHRSDDENQNKRTEIRKELLERARKHSSSKTEE